MATPGVLMRMVEPSSDQSAPQSILSPPTPCPGVEAQYTLGADDSKSPSLNTLYFLEDVSPIISSSSAYDEDVRDSGSQLSSVVWVICTFINGRDKSSSQSGSPHALPEPPATGSVVVVNGSTPQTDKEQDYHDWYDQEHGGKLTLVPGWNAARRYKFEKRYGDIETASFYGVNFYDEKNGLGGPEWQAGVTEWTMKIRSQSAKPNNRRVWKVQA